MNNKVPLSCLSVAMIAAMLGFTPAANADINCKTLGAWSGGTPKVNLHHVFCGQLNRKGRAVGYHANPNGQTPSTYKSHNGGQAANRVGIYQWKNINLSIKGKAMQKPVSSFFPNQCSKNQIVKSIQYAATHASQSCTTPRWAKCGPSAPASGAGQNYCLGNDGSIFTIATALNARGNINTGFPVNR